MSNYFKVILKETKVNFSTTCHWARKLLKKMKFWKTVHIGSSLRLSKNHDLKDDIIDHRIKCGILMNYLTDVWKINTRYEQVKNFIIQTQVEKLLVTNKKLIILREEKLLG